MSEELFTRGNSNIKLIIGALSAAAVVVVIGGFLIYSAMCPCERTPGGFLFGDQAVDC